MPQAVRGSVFVFRNAGISFSASKRLLERLECSVVVNPTVIKNVYCRVTLLDAATSQAREEGWGREKEKGGVTQSSYGHL